MCTLRFAIRAFSRVAMRSRLVRCGDLFCFVTFGGNAWTLLWYPL